MEPIGYQDGIKAFNQWFTKFGLWQRAFEQWANLPNATRATTRPPIPPAIPGRGPSYDPAVLETWPWPEKHERTERKLKDFHDASAQQLPPPEEPDPPPNHANVAPRTFNKVLPNGSDARFCVAALPRNAAGDPYDRYTIYDVNGLDKAGGRDPNKQVEGLRQANTMDDYGPCDLYPPLTAWPTESYAR